MNTDPTTLFILGLLAVNTLFRWRQYKSEVARKRRAERRWRYIQSGINQTGRP